MTTHRDELSAGGAPRVDQRYRYADVTVRSTLPLAELDAHTRDGVALPDLSFDVLASPPEPAAEDWIHRCLPAFALSFPRDFARLREVRAAIVGQSDQWAGGAVGI